MLVKTTGWWFDRTEAHGWFGGTGGVCGRGSFSGPQCPAVLGGPKTHRLSFHLFHVWECAASQPSRKMQQTHTCAHGRAHTHMFSKHRGAGMCSSALATEIWKGWEKEGQLRSSSQRCQPPTGGGVRRAYLLKGPAPIKQSSTCWIITVLFKKITFCCALQICQ